MGDAAGSAPENYFGIGDPDGLERIAGRLAAQRLYELEDSPPLTTFTRDDLIGVHSNIMQDIYPWAGEIRTTEVGAMGMAMCRTQFVDRELRPAVTAVGEGASGSLGATEGSWDNRTAAEIFHGMMESRRR